MNEVCFNQCTQKSARTLILLIKSLCLYWACNMHKKVKTSMEDWLPILEDTIPLGQFMPLEMVVHGAPGDPGRPPSELP